MTARYPILLLAGLFVAACAETQPEDADAASAQVADASADEAALEQLRADYVTHYNAHHPAVVAGMFTDSAFGLWADGQVTMGKPAIQAALEADMAGSPTLSLETGDVMVFGDHAVARGSYSVSLTPEGAGALSLAGSYITHFVKADGQWKINGVLSNYDAAPPAGVPTAELTGDPPPDEGTLAELATAYTQSMNAGDWAGVAALYTEDATVAFSNGPALQGRAAIQARLAETFTGGAPTIEIHDVGTVDVGDGYVVDGGWFTLNATTAEGAITQTGTYMSLARRDADGSWKIHWSVSNGQPKPAT